MKRLEQFRLARQKVYENLFSSHALCIAGLLIIPLFLFNQSTEFRAMQFLCFWFLCWLSGRKNKPLITVVVFLGIVFFNLLVPYGKVLVSFGFFKITLGALMTGIQRAVTLSGLFMISKLCIRRDLMFPGVFGKLTADSFRIFVRITESRRRISRKNFISDIDALMMELGGGDDFLDEENHLDEKPKQKTKATGFVIIAAVILVSCFLFLLGLGFLVK